MSLDNYHDIIERKKVEFKSHGLTKFDALNSNLKPHQAHCVDFALRAGCSAQFLDTGLGKSFVALEWGRHVVEATNKPVLMLAPLAVGPQHQREAERWGIDAIYRREPDESDTARIVITNYERLDHFDASQFSGIILDESSILKSFTGATTRKLIEQFKNTPFRMSCTATPAPNDHMELGQQSQFLGVMKSNEMLSRWFIADQANMGKYRLKRAAVQHFWEWVASWGRAIGKPSDIGFPDDGYILPELATHRHTVEADVSIDAGEERDGQSRLFRIPEMSATSIHKEKRMTARNRAEKVAALITAEPDETWIVWCDTNYEADELGKLMPDAVEVRGTMPIGVKERKIESFSKGEVKVLITKPSVAGYGLNWQHCARVAFVGLSFSYESYYQAVRRCYRFGQTRPVHVHTVCSDTESSIMQAISRKAGDHETMKREMIAAMSRAVRSSSVFHDYNPAKKGALPAWMA